MSHYLYLVETKKEYTIHLVNALAPLIYDGISSIYDDAKLNSSENEELKLFQSLLRKIPSWNNHLIEQETHRIIKHSTKENIIEDLIRAVIKSNIMILTNTPPDKKDNIKIKHDITSSKFIHNAYIEVARNVFQNPYLFSQKFNAFELKKNQRDATELIKKSIEQAIRKLLPMNVILQNYLGTTFENQTDDFQNSIPDSDYNNLRTMLNKDNILKDNVDNENYQLVKKSTNTNANLNIKLELPKQKAKPILIQSSDNFKLLKELNNSTVIDKKTSQIINNRTEKAILNSEKATIDKSKSVNKADLLSNSNMKKTITSANSHINAASNSHINAASNSHINAASNSHINAASNSHINAASNSHINAASNTHTANSTNLQTQNTSIRKNVEYDSEDASVSYFKQSNKEIVGIYDNYKKKQIGGDQENQANQENQETQENQANQENQETQENQ